MEALYVCLFSNGHIKVGRSTNPDARIAQHVARVSCMGVELVSREVVLCANSSSRREADLIARCAEAAERRFQSEWFAGLDFATVCQWAREAAGYELPADCGATFGMRLRHARAIAGMTQADLGRGMGNEGADLMKASVSAWEVDRSSPNVDQLRLICDRLCVSADWLLFGAPSRIEQTQFQEAA